MVSGAWLAFFDSWDSGFEEVARELAHGIEEAFEFSLLSDGAVPTARNGITGDIVKSCVLRFS